VATGGLISQGKCSARICLHQDFKENTRDPLP
jgi:hypothetical protein